ncbi:M23 family metallopeptidase [Rhodococcus sp. HNM0569]|uniref:peptidoglycan DD-metalloendopeptidase family protein n=1 Tax=Rhodococcus sp. HNM0569 TaxID=2716340 RepID=UPI00146F4DC8|nr:M23 family metallopeptidase [Rhodococcus sp. HNM0569]
MGSHRRTTDTPIAFVIDSTAPRGRHRDESARYGSGVKAASVAAATGAIVVGAAQLGTGTAAAHELDEHTTTEAAPAPLPFDLPDALPADVAAAVPEGLVPAGFEVPDLGPDYAQVGQQLQHWVDQLNPIKPATVQPVSGTLTSNFGSRWGAHHGGLDIAAPVGTPVLAAADGTVISAGPASGFGQWVRVLHDDGTVTVYGHVESYSVHEGERVNAGDEIATVGNRGQSTGPHLHFEVHDAAGNKTDPAAWLQQRGVAVTWTDASTQV